VGLRHRDKVLGTKEFADLDLVFDGQFSTVASPANMAFFLI
jgi:hypothetical protein